MAPCVVNIPLYACKKNTEQARLSGPYKWQVVRLNCLSLPKMQLYNLLGWQAKLVPHAIPIPSPIVLSFFFQLIYCLTFSRPDYAWNICHWTLSNQQSINHVVQSSLIKCTCTITVTYTLYCYKANNWNILIVGTLYFIKIIY